jgi:hypothetical protein
MQTASGFCPFHLKTLSKIFPIEKRGCRYGAQITENVTYYVDPPFFHKGMPSFVDLN